MMERVKQEREITGATTRQMRDAEVFEEQQQMIQNLESENEKLRAVLKHMQGMLSTLELED